MTDIIHWKIGASSDVDDEYLDDLTRSLEADLNTDATGSTRRVSGAPVKEGDKQLLGLSAFELVTMVGGGAQGVAVVVQALKTGYTWWASQNKGTVLTMVHQGREIEVNGQWTPEELAELLSKVPRGV